MGGVHYVQLLSYSNYHRTLTENSPSVYTHTGPGTFSGQCRSGTEAQIRASAYFQRRVLQVSSWAYPTTEKIDMNSW
jgi:hypothetical protein